MTILAHSDTFRSHNLYCMNSTPKPRVTTKEMDKLYWYIPSSCFVSSSVLAKAAGLPKSRAISIINALRKRGLVEVTRHGVRQKRGEVTHKPINKINPNKWHYPKSIRLFVGGLFVAIRRRRLLKKLGLACKPTKK